MTGLIVAMAVVALVFVPFFVWERRIERDYDRQVRRNRIRSAEIDLGLDPYPFDDDERR